MDELERLFNAIQQTGVIQDLPDLKTFRSSLTGNQQAQQNLHQVLSNSDKFSDVPDFETFQQSLFNRQGQPTESPGGSTDPAQPAPALPSTELPDIRNQPFEQRGFNQQTQPDELTPQQRIGGLNLRAQQLERQARESRFTQPDNTRVANPVFQNAARRAREQRDQLLQSLDTGQSRISSAANSLAKGLANTLGTDTIKSIGVVSAITNPFNPAASVSNLANIEENPVFSVGAELGRKVEETFPTNPAFQEEMLTSVLPTGLASIIAFGLGGLATRGLKLGSSLGSGALGALSVSGNEFQRAIDEGADPEEAFGVWLLNLPVGGIEAIPIANSLKKLDEATAGGVRGVLSQGFSGGMEELVQEVGQNFASNAIGKGLVNQTRSLFEGVAEGGAAGFILGGLMRGTTTAIGNQLNKLSAEQQEELKKFQETLNKEIDKSKGSFYQPTGTLFSRQAGDEGRTVIREIDLGPSVVIDPSAPPQVLADQLQNAEQEAQRQRKVQSDAGNTQAAEALEEQIERISFARQELIKETISSPNPNQPVVNDQQLTSEGQELLQRVDRDGPPGFITNNMRRVAVENGIEVNERTTVEDIIGDLRQRQNSPQPQPVSQLESQEGVNPVEASAEILPDIGIKVDSQQLTGAPTTTGLSLSMAVRDNEGNVFTAPREEAPNHLAIFERFDLNVENTDGGGFLTPDGRYLSRNEAAQYQQAVTGRAGEVPGVLFSEDFVPPPPQNEEVETLGGATFVEVTSDGPVVRDITGNPIPENDARATRSLAEFFSTQTSPAGQVQRTQRDSDLTFARRVAQESTNPVQIANELANLEDLQGSQDSEIQNNLRERFEQVTGTELSPQLAAGIQQQTGRQNPQPVTLSLSQQEGRVDEGFEVPVGRTLGSRTGQNLSPEIILGAVDGGEFFDNAASSVESTLAPSSRETIVYMTPEQFLNLAGGPTQDNGGLSQDTLIDALESLDEGFDVLPSLNLRTVQDTESMQVSKALHAEIVQVLSDEGVNMIPVKVSHPNIQFSKNRGALRTIFTAHSDNNPEQIADNIGRRETGLQSAIYPSDIDERNIADSGRREIPESGDPGLGEGSRSELIGPARQTAGTGDAQLAGALSRDSGPQERVQDPVRFRDLINELIKALKINVKKGKLSSSDAIGQFNTSTGQILVQNTEAIEVIAHEAGHDMEFRNQDLQGLLRVHAEELIPLKYESAPDIVARQEGFAEFFRLYMLNPKAAEKAAPNFHRDFQKWLQSDPPAYEPGIFDKLEQVRTGHQFFLRQASDQAVDADVSQSPSKVHTFLQVVKENSISDIWNNFKNKAYSLIVGNDRALRLALDRLKQIHFENTGESVDFGPLYDFYKLNRLSIDSYSAAAMDLEHGVMNYHTLKNEGPGLREALEVALGDDWNSQRRREFSGYLVSRRMVNEWDRFFAGELPNRPSKLTKIDYEAKIEFAESENPSFKKAADMINEYNRNMLQKLVDSGLIEQAAADRMQAKIPFYVPLYREQNKEDGIKPFTENAVGLADKARNSLIKAFGGSDKEVIDPIESMMKLTYRFNNAIKHNDTKVALLNSLNIAGRGSAEIGQEIEAFQVTPKTISGEEIKKALSKQSDWAALDELDAELLSLSMLDLDNFDFPDATIFRTSEINEKGRPIIYARVNGKVRAIQLNNNELGMEIYNTLTSQPSKNADIIANSLAYPASVLRTGITTEPSFFIANIVRDQVSAWILTDVGVKPGISLAGDLLTRARENIKGFQGPATKGEGVDEKTQREYSRLYRSFAGISTFNLSAIDDGRIQKEIENLKKKNIVIRRLTSVKAFNELLDLSETGTRLSIFQRAFQKAKKRGLSDREAAIEAGFEARDFIDFGRHGSATLYARRLVPFLNAGIQGLDKATRVLSGEGKLRQVLLPFIKDVNGRPLTPQEQREVTAARKAWLKVMEIGSIGAILAAIYADDEDYNEISPQLKATHWFLPDPTHDPKEPGPRKFIGVPKPFELAVVSNIMENVIEGYRQEDPEWYKSMSKSITQIIAPPFTAPGLAVPAELWANKSFHTGAPIVYRRLKGLEPWRQYNSYTSDFSKRVGKKLDLSPAMIDHTIIGFTGLWGRTALNLSNSVNPNAPKNGLDDTWVARRFIRSSDRGSASERRFWKSAAEGEGTFITRAATFKVEVEAAGVEAGQDYYNSLEDHYRMYAARKYFDKEVRELVPGMQVDHPLDHARKASRKISQFRREIFDEPADLDEGEVNVFTNMAPDKKRLADDLLDRLATKYYRNSLIASGDPRWKGRSKFDFEETLTKIRVELPRLFVEVRKRFSQDSTPINPQRQYDVYQRFMNSDELKTRVDRQVAAELRKARNRINIRNREDG